MLISCDTFDSRVAQEAIDAGADIINDVSAGQRDVDMHEIIRRNGVACIQMHMRGTSASMQTMTEYQGDLTTAVAQELKNNVEAAQSKGIPRWDIIADCGIGFAKDTEQSLELVRNTESFKQQIGNYPVLLGVSRKSFTKALTDLEGKSRDWATAGVIGACIARGGVDMVRVHNADMGEVVRACDAVVR